MDRRPYISGLDDAEFYNTMKTWFKWGGLTEHAKKKIEYKEDLEDYIDKEEVAEVTDAQISRVVYAIEDKIREELYEFVKELEQSRKETDNYINGILDAVQTIKESEIE